MLSLWFIFSSEGTFEKAGVGHITGILVSDRADNMSAG
jgi:hypothetical protein